MGENKRYINVSEDYDFIVRDDIEKKDYVNNQIFYLLNKQDNHIKWLDNRIMSLERRNKRQQDKLDVLYSLIEDKQWDKLWAIYFDLNREYDV